MKKRVAWLNGLQPEAALPLDAAVQAAWDQQDVTQCEEGAGETAAEGQVRKASKIWASYIVIVIILGRLERR